jgi:hypothetical protein
VAVSGRERSRQLHLRVALWLVGAAAFTAALAHLGFHYLRLGDGFARLILQ